MTKYLRRKIFKYSIYFFIIFGLFILQSVPGLMDYCSVKPLLVLPACICIAVYEGEFAGGILGFFAGVLCDSAAESVFGFNALFYMIFCTAAGLVTIYLLRRSTLNVMLISLGAILSRNLLEYFFTFYIYRYENVSVLFFQNYGPQIAYSAIFSLPLCLILRRIHDKFDLEAQ